MKILLSNDDGILSPGLFALAKGLDSEHELFIAAPDSERSAASHALTLSSPLRAKKVALSGLEHIPSYAVSGTPADCVKIALGNLCEKPDVVVSGVNLGANKGTDVFYSGTVSAAMEGAIYGVPAIAVSNISYPPKHYETAVAAVKYALDLMHRDNYCAMLMNINVPDVPLTELKGYVITPAGQQIYEPAYHEYEDPRKQKYYWAPITRLTTYEAQEDSDERWTSEGYAALTPLMLDLTDYAGIARLRKLQDK